MVEGEEVETDSESEREEGEKENEEESEEEMEEDSVSIQGIFCLSLGAELWPHSQSYKATFSPMPCLFFPPIKKSKKNK